MKIKGLKIFLQCCMGCFILMFCAGLVWASDPIKKSKIPDAVMQAAEKDSQGRNLIGTYADFEEGRMIYELRYDDGKGGWVELNYEEEGTLIEKETRITLDQVPPQVLKALKTRAPNLKININHIEKAERYKKYSNGKAVTLIWYEFDESHDIDRGKGKKCDVEINAEGTVVVFEIEPQHK